MQILINVVLICGMIYILFQLLQLRKLQQAFDNIIIRFIKIVNTVNDNNKKLVDIIAKPIDKLEKSVYNLSMIQKEVDELRKATISYNHLNSQHNENINTGGRLTKEVINSLKFKINELDKKINKLNASAMAMKSDHIRKK